MNFSRYKTICLLLLVAAIILAGTIPGKRPPINRVSTVASEAGLRLDPPSQILAEAPLWSTTGEFTLELWLRPDVDPRFPEPGNREIASFVDGSGVRPLLLGQWRDGFFLRSRFDNPTGDPSRDHYSDFPLGVNDVHLAVIGHGNETQLFANGRSTSIAIPRKLAKLGIPFGGRLLLGSSGGYWSEWKGWIDCVAFHTRALPRAELAQHASVSCANLPARKGTAPTLRALYEFSALEGNRIESEVASAPTLLIPKRVAPLHRPVLSFAIPTNDQTNWLTLDLTLNILGFVPLGLLLAWRRGLQGILMAVCAGLILSLAIELAQLWIPGRDSSGIDLLCNVFGAILGGFVASSRTCSNQKTI